MSPVYDVWFYKEESDPKTVAADNEEEAAVDFIEKKDWSDADVTADAWLVIAPTGSDPSQGKLVRVTAETVVQYSATPAVERTCATCQGTFACTRTVERGEPECPACHTRIARKKADEALAAYRAALRGQK